MQVRCPGPEFPVRASSLRFSFVMWARLLGCLYLVGPDVYELTLSN